MNEDTSQPDLAQQMQNEISNRLGDYFIVDFAGCTQRNIEFFCQMHTKDTIELLSMLPSILPNFKVLTSHHMDEIKFLTLFLTLNKENYPRMICTNRKERLINALVKILDDLFTRPDALDLSYIHKHSIMNEFFFSLIPCQQDPQERCLIMRIFLLWLKKIPENLNTLRFVECFMQHCDVFELLHMNETVDVHLTISSLCEFKKLLLNYLYYNPNHNISGFWIRFVCFLGEFFGLMKKLFDYKNRQIDIYKLFEIVTFFLSQKDYRKCDLEEISSDMKEVLMRNIITILDVLLFLGLKMLNNFDITEYRSIKIYLTNAYNLDISKRSFAWPDDHIIYKDFFSKMDIITSGI